MAISVPVRRPAQPTLVLIADDEVAIQVLIARQLQCLGLTALLVNNGQAAIAAVETRGNELACVILDVVMPKVGGVDAALAIQHMAPSLPLALMSGAVPVDDTARITRLSRVGFLHKPFSLGELRRIMQRAIAQGAETAV